MDPRDAELQQRRKKRLAVERAAAEVAARKRRGRHVVYGLLVALAATGIAVGIMEGAGAIVAVSGVFGSLIAVACWAGRAPNRLGEQAPLNQDAFYGSAGSGSGGSGLGS